MGSRRGRERSLVRINIVAIDAEAWMEINCSWYNKEDVVLHKRQGTKMSMQWMKKGFEVV